MSKLGFLMSELDSLIERFDKESTKHKRMYRTFRYAVFFMTAISTALASLSLTFPNIQWISLGIVLLTATIGVVTSIEGLRKPADLWVHERATLYSLKDIRRELEFKTTDDNNAESVDEIFDRLQAVLGGAGDKWQRQIVKEHTETSQAGTGVDAPQTRGN